MFCLDSQQLREKTKHVYYSCTIGVLLVYGHFFTPDSLSPPGDVRSALIGRSLTGSTFCRGKLMEMGRSWTLGRAVECRQAA